MLSSNSFVRWGVFGLLNFTLFAGLAVAPVQASTTSFRVYVAGESIERRNCMSEAPFTASGALNDASNNDDAQYGWMMPFAERLKLRRPGLTVQFVGADTWLAGDDYPYDGRGNCRYYPTPGNTSAMSGSDNEAWLDAHGNELRNKQFCYDAIFVSRGGNDKQTDDAEYKRTLTQIIDLGVHGSSCQTNPLVYVTGHMPDNEVNATTGDAKFVVRVRDAVNQYTVAHPSARVRFVDQFTPFKNNTPTTAFPTPNWRSGAGFNMSVIGREGDGLHPKRFASIYAGEVAANALSLDEITTVMGEAMGSSSTPTPTPTPIPVPTPAPVPTPVTPAPMPVSDGPVVTPSTGPSAPPALAAPADHYSIGTPTLQDIWVDPVAGNDSNSGATRAQALRSLATAYHRIPNNQALRTGYRILLARGTYTTENMPNYWENLLGTADHPIIVQSADGRGAAVLTHDINAGNLHYFYLIDVNITPVPAGDPLHFTGGDHLLVRGVILNGGNQQAHETLKINQAQYVYVEDSDISGADDNAIDFVAVQYGHIINNKIHNTNDWCMYTKGGSAYFQISGNEIYDCGVGGYTAGQGTGIQYMVAPWLQYEAYDIKFVNNVIHDTGTSGLGVNGGYNILMAYNTLYRVGIGLNGPHDNNHPADHLFEANQGGHTCDNTDERPACTAKLVAGAWGSMDAEPGQPIPNKNVFVYNNLFVNPSGAVAPWMFQVAAPANSLSSARNISGPQAADQNLQIKGNVIVNGSDDIGLGDATGCGASNPTCNPAQLRLENRINQSGLTVQFVDPTHGDFRLATGVNLSQLAAIAIPSFAGGDRPVLTVPAGDLANMIATDRTGGPRAGGNLVGAYLNGAALVTPPLVIEPTSPRPGTSPTTPVVSPTNPVVSPAAGGGLGTPVVTTPSTPIIVTPVRADVSVRLFATPYPSLVQNTNVAVRLTVKNDGPATAENVSVNIPTPANTTVVSITRASQGGCSSNAVAVRCDLGDMRNGRSIAVTITYKPRTVGAWTPEATVMTNTADLNTANNQSTVRLTVTAAPQANLVGRFVSATQSCRMVQNVERCSLSARVEIRNTGTKTSPATRFKLSLSHDESLDEKDSLLKNYAVGSIAIGKSRTVNVTIPSLPAIYHPAILFGKVDATSLVLESNETDNQFSTQIR